LLRPKNSDRSWCGRTPDGGTVRVRDVARIELGSQDYSVLGRLNGQTERDYRYISVARFERRRRSRNVKKLMAQMKQRFPEDIDYVVALDQTRAVTEGIKEIVKTLLIALALVILVVYLFPAGLARHAYSAPCGARFARGHVCALPGVRFFHQYAFSSWLVLAIGLVVDDAIVVVEGVERHIEEGLTPKNAALKAMEELSGPVVGIALVLSAVFVPTAFIPGITGRLYQQFAVTVAISVLLSAFQRTYAQSRACRTTSPAAGAKPRIAAKIFDWFNRSFGRATEGYVRWSAALIRKTAVVVVSAGGLGLAGGFFANRVPSEFPSRRRSRLCVRQSPATQRSFLGTYDRSRGGCRKDPCEYAGVQYTTSVIGFSLLELRAHQL